MVSTGEAIGRTTKEDKDMTTREDQLFAKSIMAEIAKEIDDGHHQEILIRKNSMKTIESFINEIECDDQRIVMTQFWSKLVSESLTADQIKNITAIANMMPSWSLLGWDFDHVQYHIRYFCNMEDRHDLQTKVETVLFRIAGDYYFTNLKKIG